MLLYYSYELVMQFKRIFGVLAILNSGLMFGVDVSNKEYYDETSRNLSVKYDPDFAKLHRVLDGARVFDRLEGDSTVAKMYLTTRIMELPIKNFELIVQKHQDLFLKTLFGRSLILGWMVHFYDDPSKLFQFNKYTHSYHELFKVMARKTGAIAVVDRLQPLHSDEVGKFYTHSVWLSSASKELASSGYKPHNYPIEEAFYAALKQESSHEEGEHYYKKHREESPLLINGSRRLRVPSSDTGSGCPCCTIL